MLHEARSWISYEALTHAAGEEASERDQDGSFPTAAFEALHQLGVTGHPPLAADEAQSLFRVLAAAGRGNLSVARIFEGHVNALLLIRLFGSEAQRVCYASLASRGDLFGIWNTDVPGDAVKLEGKTLRGKKNFASGVDGINYALITAKTPKGRQLVIVSTNGLEIDRSWWHPLGMKASGSHVVNFEDTVFTEQELIGSPGDYLKEPWFSGGALRASTLVVCTPLLMSLRLISMRRVGPKIPISSIAWEKWASALARAMLGSTTPRKSGLKSAAFPITRLLPRSVLRG